MLVLCTGATFVGTIAHSRWHRPRTGRTTLRGAPLAIALLVAVGTAWAAPPSVDGDAAAFRVRPDQLLVTLYPKSPAPDLADGNALSGVLRRQGAVAVRRAFPAFDPAAGGVPADLRAARVRDRFPDRAARVPAPRRPPDLENVWLVQLDGRADLRDALAAIAADGNVRDVEPNRVFRITATPLPAEPLLPRDRYVSSDGVFWSEGAVAPGLLDLWGLWKVRAIEGWNRFDTDGSGDFGPAEKRPGEGVVVAVVDTGVDVAHPDLAGNLWSNPGEIPGNGIDDDGNGFVDDAHGWDFVDDDPDPEDLHGHGTHVAGTLAARSDDRGVVGVAPFARVMPLKGLGDDGSGSLIDLANAVVHAGDWGADVVSNSWGGIGVSPTLDAAFRYVESLGVLAIASAGNASSNVGGFVPASYPSVLAVAATDADDRRASFTNTGRGVAISAPGVDVLSLHANGSSRLGDARPGQVVDTDWLVLSGTSMSAPHVAGAAAVLISFRPSESLVDLRARLLSGAVPIDALNPGSAGALGRGRVDVLGSLDAIPRPLLRITRASAPDAAPGASADLVVAIRNEWVGARDVSVRLSSRSPDAVVLAGSSSLGDLGPQQQRDNEGDPFRVAFSPSAALGDPIPFELRLEYADGLVEDLPFGIALTQFADVSDRVGLPLFDVVPWSAALQDFDGDGAVDAQWIGLLQNLLFRNVGRAFQVALGTGLQTASVGPSQALFLDVDDDGDRDLFFAGFNDITGSQLYENLGGGQFADVTDASGTRGLRAFTATAFDWDRDGRVDFLGSSTPNGAELPGQGLFLMRNEGEGRFADVAREACLDPSVALRSGEVRTLDHDGDGILDLLMVSPEHLLLYRGSADGRFFDVTRDAGLVSERPSALVCEFRRRFGLSLCTDGASGIAVGDYDDDGDLDVFLTGRGDADTAPSRLLRNDGEHGFRDATAGAGDLADAQIAGMHRGNAFVDYDNDGDLDLYVTNEGLVGDGANRLYRNDGGGRFRDVNAVAFPPDKAPGGAAAGFGDYDRDGTLDLWAPAGVLGAGEGAFFENRFARRHHGLSLRLRGTRSHPDAFGARVMLRAGGRTQHRELAVSAVDPERLHFGLGDAGVADEIRIRWPSGVVQTLFDVSADRTLDVVEPEECAPLGGDPVGAVSCPDESRRRPDRRERLARLREDLRALRARILDLWELAELLRDLRAQDGLAKLAELSVSWDRRCRRFDLHIGLRDPNAPDEEPGSRGLGRGRKLR